MEVEEAAEEDLEEKAVQREEVMGITKEITGMVPCAMYLLHQMCSQHVLPQPQTQVS